ncbi:P-loop containing nucleoside triphosphate hydrolase protein [Spinellus fusiger]|nr:P-loop containing nucleoside triphosphate hydrolase protein [Spinellus fusiger]
MRVVKPSIDKFSRRMTLSGQSVSRAMPPPKTPMRDRPSTLLSRRDFTTANPPFSSAATAAAASSSFTGTSGVTARSPARSGHRSLLHTINKPTSPKPKITSASVQKVWDELSMGHQRNRGKDTALMDSPTPNANTTTSNTNNTNNTTRLVDVYGAPISQQKRRMSVDPSAMSLGGGWSSGLGAGRPSVSTLDQFLEFKETQKMGSANVPAATQPGVDLHQRIRVCVRKRPLSKKEAGRGDRDIVPVMGPHRLEVQAPKTRIDMTPFIENYSFTFDDVFDSKSTPENIYNRTAKPLVDYMLKGRKATCFAYGQTGSGKTYTMLDPQKGLYILAAEDIFTRLNQPQYTHLNAYIGFYEIYQNKLFDLLNERKLLVPRTDGNNNVVIAGILEVPVLDVTKLMHVFEFGNNARMTGKTGANEFSSRSHAVLQILIKNINKPSNVHGKLSFIDLAGSERGADRGEETTSTTRREGAEINKSLLALKECIRALDQEHKHAPFRGSKLTQVLRDSFIGDSRTCMIATISPNVSNSEHTLNTLRYADRVKEIKGESDPRLSKGRQEANKKQKREVKKTEPNTKNYETYEDIKTPESPDLDLTVDLDLKNRKHTMSRTPSFSHLENEVAEDLWDTEYPSETSDFAFDTPQPEQEWQQVPPERQEAYMRRLSTPPNEIFNAIAEDPSTPQQSTLAEDTLEDEDEYHTPDHKDMDEEMTSLHHDDEYRHSSPVASPNDSEHVLSRTSSFKFLGENIQDFNRFHLEQMKVMDESQNSEKKMLTEFALMLANHNSSEGESSTDKMAQHYKNYQSNLKDLLEQRKVHIDALCERIRLDLLDNFEAS